MNTNGKLRISCLTAVHLAVSQVIFSGQACSQGANGNANHSPADLFNADYWEYVPQLHKLQTKPISIVASIYSLDEVYRYIHLGGFSGGSATIIGADQEAQKAVLILTYPRSDKRGPYLVFRELPLKWDSYLNYVDRINKTGIWGIPNIEPAGHEYQPGFNDNSTVVYEKLLKGRYFRRIRIQSQTAKEAKVLEVASNPFDEAYRVALGMRRKPLELE